MTAIKPTIFVVDDDAAVRASLGRLLLTEGYTVQTFASGREFLQDADTQATGVLLLDLSEEPDGSDKTGKTTFALLKKVQSPMVVVFISAHGSIPDATEVVKAGALEWLVKPLHADRVFPVVAKAYELAKSRQHGVMLWARLTPAEKEVAPLVAKGLSSRDVGLALDKNPRTVDTQRAEIFRKLELGNSNELLQFMMDHGLMVRDSKN